MGFLAASNSVRGLSHIAGDTPCQDASGCCVVGDGTAVIAVVADGGGSLPLSHIGARITVQATLNALFQLAWANKIESLTEDEWRCFWRNVVHDVRAAIEEEARLMGANFSLFGATLLAIAATRNTLSAMQIGDGFVVFSRSPISAAEKEQTEGFELAFKPGRGEYAGETTWATSPRWDTDFQCKTFPGPIGLICIASDGLEKVAINQRENAPHAGFFGPVKAATDAGNLEHLKQYLADLLTDKRLDRKTDDDKSMVLAVWCGT